MVGVGIIDRGTEGEIPECREKSSDENSKQTRK
jgi:hypothetical protein